MSEAILLLAQNGLFPDYDRSVLPWRSFPFHKMMTSSIHQPWTFREMERERDGENFSFIKHTEITLVPSSIFISTLKPQ